eukprot:comp9485_c0_seq1/m.11002 comp9485_c0_seq1/g.11002  ORF comp9485_c0_seq1/g.11002 comp9485_c0_seq1/m.11002 type:complete len:183 (+) comp9485_c0_seq1:3-551(+)
MKLFVVLCLFSVVLSSDIIRVVDVLGFSYSNCGSASDPFEINALNLSPDPISLSHNVTASGSCTVTAAAQLSSPLSVTIELKKKIGIWVTIPCVDNVGSCTYNDICALLPSGNCPPWFEPLGLPCHCPIPAGNYKFPSASFPINLGSKVPSWLTDGEFQVQATVAHAGTRQLCINIQLTIAK